MNKEKYPRRKSRAVRVGNAWIGGDHPILVQSMTNTSTLDTEASAAQAKRIADAGAGLVRLTTQGVKEAANMAEIKRALRDLGCDVPLSADVHFNPKAAFEAAKTSDKVRINPGNFVDAARTFKQLEFSDEEYAREIGKIREAFIPFLEICRQHGTSVRLGVNHGSLSDRIMSRYGNTAPGMVESVMEYLRIARETGFDDIVISVKASNTVVMVETVRLLAETMEREGMDYPLHLGVTEAGDAEDGRIKSAVGIGALLHEGLGDTIRVSLSEPPENEVPVARLLIEHVEQSNAKIREIGEKYAAELAAAGQLQPLMELEYDVRDLDELRVRAAADFGYLLMHGYGKEIRVIDPHFDADTLRQLELDILQAARVKFSKTEFIACPSCGRTLFDLPTALQEVKKAVAELGVPGLKIGVMGCIVNGPGEMADADYGYVGAGPGRVSIYRGKEAVIKNIPTDEALPALIALIREERKNLQND